MPNNLVNCFSLLASLYNHLVVVKSAATSEYYYNAHQTEQDQKTFRHDLYAAVNQDYILVTDATEEFISDDKIMENDVADDFCLVGADSIPSVDNVLPSFSSISSASNLINYVYHAASVVAKNTTQAAICVAVRSCNFVWSEKKHTEGFVQEKTKKFAQPKIRGFGVDFANVSNIRFNLATA
ncbi:hypothetical protein MAM1_0029c02318 [Mucor ambiguus]|uniref:Uncharacterized protein n=1 Tax=Mucor ambiguus TaxID=91626 RepID=A0A0C9M7E1_9FUNG|nr:hypothetical protein MAM1_0029c02318 [Mucor ambiguus]